MLIRFHFENFLSFKSETEFSMVSGGSTQHPNHLIKAQNSFTPDILRTTAIFGKNASGKSNFIQALNFAKELITNSPTPGSKLGVRPYKLASEYTSKPTSFKFELLLDGKVFEYGFILDNKIIIEEWLYEILRTTEKPLFHRKKDILTLGKIDYSASKNEASSKELLKDKQLRLYFVGEDTRDNQLFLTATIERNQPYFREVYDWFDNSLYIIRPDSKYLDTEFQMIEGRDENFIDGFQELLKEFDTGIEGIEITEVDVNKDLVKAYPHITDLKESIEELEPMGKALLTMPDERRFAIKKNKNGIVLCYKLMTKHKKLISDSHELFEKTEDYERFEINWESQGTQRLMDLIPLFFVMRNTSSTIFIDEIARSLHPELSYKLVKIILGNKNLFKSQFIFTSHEDYLLDLNLLRRDEVWFADKDKYGASTMYSLEEYKPRYDKDIRKGYLHGRFGGIPMIDEDGINQVLSH